MNKYFFVQNIQSKNGYLIKCNILVLLFKYLNYNFLINFKYFINQNKT